MQEAEAEERRQSHTAALAASGRGERGARLRVVTAKKRESEGAVAP
jgi:hypothetical protein